MRNTKVPLVCRAWAQLNRAVRIRPTCGVPVGDGQNRTRTGVSAVTSPVEAAGAELGTASAAEAVVIVVPTLPISPSATRPECGHGTTAAEKDSRPVDPRGGCLKSELL